MKLVPLIIVPFAAALALAACGESPGAEGASAGEPDDKAELAFARCMREEGIDFPDPGAEGSGPRAVRIGKDTSPQKLRASTEKCRKRTGGGPQPPSEEQQAEFRDAALKFARCMRAEGIDIPDPQVGSGGGIIQRGPGPDSGAPDPGSSAFRRAEQKCEDLLPKGRGGRGEVRVGRSRGSDGGGASVSAAPGS